MLISFAQQKRSRYQITVKPYNHLMTILFKEKYYSLRITMKTVKGERRSKFKLCLIVLEVPQP